MIGFGKLKSNQFSVVEGEVSSVETLNHNLTRLTGENVTIDVQDNKIGNKRNADTTTTTTGSSNIGGDLDCCSDTGIDESKNKLSYSYRFKHHRTVSDSVRLLNRHCSENITGESVYVRRDDTGQETTTLGPMLLKSQSYHDENLSSSSKTTAIKKDGINAAGFQNLIENDLKFGTKINNLIGAGDHIDNDTSIIKPSLSAAAAAAAAAATAAATLTTTTSISVGYPPLKTTKRRTKLNIVRGTRYTFCGNIKNLMARSSLLTYIIPVLVLAVLISLAYFTREYTKRVLYWIETQNHWIIFVVYILLFIVVSFPIIVGYLVLMVTAGYLLGTVRGLFTVIIGANIGIAVVHMTIRNLRYRLPLQKIIKNDTGRAILRVISGPRAFKVVMFTRLTPIPFGLQNVIFGVSAINSRTYHMATFCGLLPAQIINVYLGSTLRSMQEVLSNHGTAMTGYISFALEAICGIGLMFWVVRKARRELSETLLSDLNSGVKMENIQV